MLSNQFTPHFTLHACYLQPCSGWKKASPPLPAPSDPLPQNWGWALLPGTMPRQPEIGPGGTLLWLAMKHWERRGGNTPKEEWTHCGAALSAGMETWRQKPLGYARELRGKVTNPNLDPPILKWLVKMWSWAGGDYLWQTSGEPQASWHLEGNLHNFSHCCLMLENNHQSPSPTHL